MRRTKTPALARLVSVGLLALLLLAAPSRAAEDDHPRQVHLALTGDPTEMVVTWASAWPGDGYIEYGRAADNLNLTAQATTRTYEWLLVIHEALLEGLEPGARYYYHVGETDRWSPTYTFRAAPAGPADVTIGAVADQGTSDEAQLVTSRMAGDALDLVVFPGDLAYAYAAQPLWDQWGEQITPVAAEVPHMFAPGNHEDEPGFNFAAYETRFYRPSAASGSSSPFYYSFNFSSLHFISLSSEHAYEPGSVQYQWLARDLAVADANRQAQPWVVLFVHRPLYSSSSIHGSEAPLREAIEELLLTFRVDLTIAGHDHDFERTYPVYNGVRLSNATGTYADPYRDPTGPIHVVAGTGGGLLYGTLPLIEPFVEPQPVWSAYREEQHGYTRFHVTRDTLNYEFVRTDGAVAHEFWITRTRPPLTFIEAITPSPAEQGVAVSFAGRTEGGAAAGYRWSSSLDGELGSDLDLTATLTPGHHTISFAASDAGGNWSAPATRSLWVYALPEAHAGANLTVAPGAMVLFNGTGSDADGEIVLYEWDFEGDGEYDWSSVEAGVANHTYAAGSYTAVLRVTDSDGFNATANLTVTVLAPAAEDGSLPAPSLLLAIIALATLTAATAAALRRRRSREP